jgi:predicted nuclease with TOPRIM domain
LWDEVRAVIDGVESERLSPPQANSMVRAYSTLIALERLRIEESELEIQQRRLRLDEEERTELRARLEELEQHVQTARSPWGA